MSLPTISKTRKFISTALTWWIPIKSYRRAFRGILQLGVMNYFRVLRTDRNTTFPVELAVGAIMKDEGPYLKEWLDFHILVGVGKFYLYDNGSTDNTADILKPYIDQGIVEYHYFPGPRMQAPAYVEILNNHANDSRWLALIDLDEFLVPVNHKTIPEFLHTMPQNFAQLVVTWVMYGSSGHIEKPDGLVMENYKYHAARQSGIKSIINPRLFLKLHSLHANLVGGFTIDNNGKKLGRIDQTNNPPPLQPITLQSLLHQIFQRIYDKIQPWYSHGTEQCLSWPRQISSIRFERCI